MKSAVVKRQNFDRQDGGVLLGPVGVYAIRFSERPWEGPFRIRCHVAGLPSKSGKAPRLKVYIGYQATGVIYARSPVGEVDVRTSQDKPGVVEFSGYMEEFPQAFVEEGSSGRVNQGDLILWFENSTPENGSPADLRALAGQRNGSAAKKLRAKLKVAERNRKRVRKDPDKAKEYAATIDKLQTELAELTGQAGAKKAEILPRTARLFIDRVEFEGPYFESWPPQTRTRLLPQPVTPDSPAYVRSVLSRFMTRAWRRPVRDDEVNTVFAAYQKHSKYGFDEALTDTMAAVLCSPHFLYLAEASKKSDQIELTAHELASRLSYFLWASLPDERLMSLADSGELLDRDVLGGQVVRMLDDPKASRLADNFAAQWLDLDSMQRVAVNPEYYPLFEDETKQAMREETLAYFRHVLFKDRSSLELLDSDYAMLNERLGRHYGIAGVIGAEFRPVKVTPDQHRGGLLTQGAFMLANSDGADSHPILRGKWLLERLLNDPPPAPPANVPELEQADPEFAKLPLKEKLAIHRRNPACASCHDDLDPWGLALENFDAVGRWRTDVALKNQSLKGKRRKPELIPVDSAAVLATGDRLAGVDDLKKYLVTEKRGEFAEAIVRRLLAYSLGRSLEWTDRDTVAALTANFTSKHDFRLRPLIKEVVLSDAFRSR